MRGVPSAVVNVASSQVAPDGPRWVSEMEAFRTVQPSWSLEMDAEWRKLQMQVSEQAGSDLAGNSAV